MLTKTTHTYAYAHTFPAPAPARNDHLLVRAEPPEQPHHDERLEQHDHGLAVGADGVSLEHVVHDRRREEENIGVDGRRGEAHQGLGLPHSCDLWGLVGKSDGRRGVGGQRFLV